MLGFVEDDAGELADLSHKQKNHEAPRRPCAHRLHRLCLGNLHQYEVHPGAWRDDDRTKNR